MRLLDVFIATLIVFPRLAGWISFETASAYVELSDLGVPLLAVALVFEAPRHWRGIAWRERLWTGAAVLALLIGLWWLFNNYRDLSTRVLWHLTHGAGAVLAVALVGVAIRRRTREPWEASFFVRLGMKVVGAWADAVERAGTRPIWMAAAAVGFALFCIAVMRHWAFDSHGYDLGIFTNVMWNLTHGNGYVSSVKGGINLFTDHQSPTYWLLAPAFWLVPRPEMLFLVQAFGLAAGGPALYHLGVARFGRAHWAAAALPWLYWAYLPMRNANAFDFHPEVLMLPLFLWAFVGFAAEHRWAKALGLAALAAALGAKESAPVVAVGIGIAWTLNGGRWRGVALAATGVVIFFFDVKVVPRFFEAGDYAYMGLYDRFGGGLVDLMLAPFTQPVYFLSQLINAERLNFLFWTLAPLGFMPLFHWRTALAAVPPYLMLFLSEGDQRVRIVFHYGIEPGSALFWALPFGIAAFAQRFGWQRVGVWMLVWALAGYGPGEVARARGYLPVPYTEWLASEVMPCLNPEAPMAASDTFVPHLATRAWIGYPDQLEQRPSGSPVSCVVTDLKAGLNWPLGRGGVERVLATLPERGYREVYRCSTFTVYELGNAGCLRCVPRCD